MTEETLFTEALDIADPAARAAFLDRACGGQPDLRGRLDRLLAEHAQAGNFLGQPAALPRTFGTQEYAAEGRTCDIPTVHREGAVLGPYKLVEVIGEGGMGTVWLAQQQEPVKRLVALKVIKPGMDSRQVLARFEAERQALALMDHPNIAKVLDGGATPDGRPFFAMELVKGVPITKFCDERKLTPRERLELFVPVCLAVQHAHQKGVIHRDIKPSNVLVALYDGRPVPKVIDFGVAKAAGQPLTEKTLITGLGAVVGTPEYMSPEQAELNQLDIDTRSDIYSLGILLYELLTGTTPLQHKRVKEAALLEVLRLVREEEPPRPSTRLSTTNELPSIAANRGVEPRKLSGLMRGELDWIVMKALDKDRSRRYETANGFALDVQRYLADEAVQACPPSAGYRLRKFARRNKRGLAVAGLALAILMLMGGSVGWAIRDRGARQARAAGQVELILAEVDKLEKEQKWPEALAAARRAEAVVAGGEADAATAERVHARLKDLEFIDRLERVRMDRAATGGHGTKFDNASTDREYARAFSDYGVDLEELSVEASIDRLKARPALALPVAAVLDQWMSLQSGGTQTNVSLWKRLVAVSRGIDPDPFRDWLRSTHGRHLAEASDELCRLAESIDVRSHHPATLISLSNALRFARQPSLELLRKAQTAHLSDFWLNYELAHKLGRDKNHAGAVRFFTAAVSLRPDSHAAWNNLGVALKGQKMLDEAVAAHRRAIELDPKRAHVHSNLGLALCGQKKFDEAVAACRKAIELDKKLSSAHNNLGAVLIDQRKLAEAAACFRRAIELDASDAGAQSNLGYVLTRQQKLDEAVPVLRKAVALDPNHAGGHHNLGIALHRQKKLAEAVAAFRRAIELDPTMVNAHGNLGVVLKEQGKLDEAAACFRKVSELAPKDTLSYSNLGNVLREQGKLDEAVTVLRTAVKLDPQSTDAFQQLGWTLYRFGDWPGSIEALEKSCKLQQGGKGDAGQWVVLALAYARLAAKDGLTEQERTRHKAEARRLYEQSNHQIVQQWKWKTRPGGGFPREIWDFREEARTLIGAAEKDK